MPGEAWAEGRMPARVDSTSQNAPPSCGAHAALCVARACALRVHVRERTRRPLGLPWLPNGTALAAHLAAAALAQAWAPSGDPGGSARGARAGSVHDVGWHWRLLSKRVDVALCGRASGPQWRRLVVKNASSTFCSARPRGHLHKAASPPPTPRSMASQAGQLGHWPVAPGETGTSPLAPPVPGARTPRRTRPCPRARSQCLHAAMGERAISACTVPA